MRACSARLLLYLLLAVSILPGCLRLDREPSAKTSYALSALRPAGTTARSPGTKVLQVTPMRIAPQFAGRSFIYRMGDLRYQADFYHEFFISPSSMLQEATVNWLSDCGLFAAVGVSAGPLPPDYLLQARIHALYGDFQAEQRYAILDISFMLLDQYATDTPVLMQRRYGARTPLDDNTPEALARAWDAGLADVLAQLEQDLATALVPGFDASAPGR